MNDTQIDWVEGQIIELEPTPQWCRVLLDDGRIVTAIDPKVSKSPDVPPRLGDVVVIGYTEGYCLISTNKDREASSSGG